MTGKTTNRWVAGVDGCPDGWMCVFRTLDDPAASVMHFHASFADIVEDKRRPEIIAVDMPIGFPDRLNGGGRTCEQLVRKLLGPRQSSVFATPARGVIHATEYRDGCEMALRLSDPPRKISKQAYNLFPKIREVDDVLTPTLNEVIFEVHPEAAFWALNDCAPIPLPKKIKSRPNPDGLQMRTDLLKKAGYLEKLFKPIGKLPGHAGLDDLIDAAVCSWSACRIATGQALSFPDPPEWDANGNRMAITV